MKQTRSRPCGRTDAEFLLEKAYAFAQLADLVEPLIDKGAELSAAVSNAANAGIAASDAICCQALQKRPRSQNHNDAPLFLAGVRGVGPSAAKHLKVLLAAKPKAQYQMRPLSPTETKRCIRAMRNLIAIAQEVLCRD